MIAIDLFENIASDVNYEALTAVSSLNWISDVEGRLGPWANQLWEPMHGKVMLIGWEEEW